MASGPSRKSGGARVDYSLARRATLQAFHAGRTSRLEICDAHPELLRAARSTGDTADAPCPVCDARSLLLVSYVFSEELPKRENGAVWPRGDLGPLLKFREVRVYTIEVCVECSWNHLLSQVTIGHGGARKAARRGRRAST